MAAFASYGLERSISKHQEEFGKGAIEGVAGPESANNAAAGGAMIPLLSLGLPFTPATAVLLGGMLLHGITPGPFLLRDRPDVFWGVIGSFYLGNAMLLILNLPLVGIFAKIVRVPSRYLMPVILVLCAIGAYGDNGALFDVWVMLGAGVLGYVMRKYGYRAGPARGGAGPGTRHGKILPADADHLRRQGREPLGIAHLHGHVGHRPAVDHPADGDPPRQAAGEGPLDKFQRDRRRSDPGSAHWTESRPISPTHRRGCGAQ